MRNDLKLSADDPRVIACKKAVKLMGGLSKTSRHFGITPQAVYKWEVVPQCRCLAVARITGIDVQTLRPDVYGEKKTVQRARGKSNAITSPATTTQMDRRGTPDGQGFAGERGDSLSHRQGVSSQSQSGIRPHIPRSGDVIAALSENAKDQPPGAFPFKAEETGSTSTAQCGYGGRSW